MKLRTTFRALIALTLSVLVACATVGRQFDTTHVNDIEVGVQSKEDIRAGFGEPHDIQNISNPQTVTVERWMYTYSHSQFGRGTTSHSLVVDFDASSKVCAEAYTRTE